MRNLFIGIAIGFLAMSGFANYDLPLSTAILHLTEAYGFALISF